MSSKGENEVALRMRSYSVTAFDAPLQERVQDTPEVSGAQVLVRISAAGVCHTDLHVHEGFYDLGGGKRLRMVDRGVVLPLTLGHEIAGQVVSVGADVSSIKVGQNVLVYPWIGCNDCAMCARGMEHYCSRPRYLGIFRNGGYSTHVLVPDARYCADIGKTSPQMAAPFACSGLTTYSALRKISVDLLQRTPTLLIGAGGLGLMCLSLMKLLGAKGAIVADINPEKRKAALDAGALAVIDPAVPDAVKQVQSFVEGGLLESVIDMVGTSSSVQFGLDSLCRGGKFVAVGLLGGDITIPTPLLAQRALSIQGSFVGSLREFSELVELLQSGKLSQIPTSVLPLDAANDALDKLKAGAVIGRIVLQP